MLTFEESMIPVWDTDVIYGESLTMIRDEQGIAKAPLLFQPLEILSVTDAKCTEQYEAGKDFYIDGASLILTDESRIFAFTMAELRPKEWVKGQSFPFQGGNILFREGSFFHEHQISVTYTCRNGQWSGVKPESAADFLPKIYQKLQQKEPFRLLAYGDSITHGFNTSQQSSIAPYQGSYCNLLVEGLYHRFGSIVQLLNHAIAGKDSQWGLENLERLVNNYVPDLIILAFGMNDLKRTAKEFAANMRMMVAKIRTKNPTCEIILVATSTPNPILTDPRAPFYAAQPFHKEELDKIAADYSGIAVADITGMQAYLHSRKRFIDTTGNNVNHPNDFFHRLYAQYLLGMFTAENS